MSGNNELRYTALPFFHESHLCYLVVNKETYRVYAPLCFYAAYLSKTLKPNSVRNYVNNLLVLATWADIFGLDLEAQLRAGKPFSKPLIAAFSRYLGALRTTRGQLSPSYVNSLLTSARLLSEYYQSLAQAASLQGLQRKELLAKEEARNWKAEMRTTPDNFISKQLSTHELSCVDEYLHPDKQVSLGMSKPVAVRNYLIWLYLREFGLRGGELLSLRLAGLPMKSDCWLVVPELNTNDPRGRYAPSTKTGARELALIDNTSAIMFWTEVYLNEHRFPDEETYFLTSTRGKALSTASLQKLAQCVQKNVAPYFRWHRVRHTRAVEWLEIIVEASEDAESFRSLFDALERRMGWNHPSSSKPYLDVALHKLNEKRLKRLVQL